MMEKKLTNKRLVSALMELAHIDRIVINDHAVTVRIKQSRVDQHRVTDADFQKLKRITGHDDAMPLTKEVSGHLEMWVRFNRY